MAIARRTRTAGNFASGAANCTITLPTGATTGDLILVAIGTVGTSSIAKPADWTSVDSTTIGTSSQRHIEVWSAAYSPTLTLNLGTNVSALAAWVCQAFYAAGGTVEVDTSAGTSSTGNNATLPTGAPTPTQVGDTEELVYIWGSSTTIQTWHTADQGSAADGAVQANSTTISVQLGQNSTNPLATDPDTAFSQTLAASNTRKRGVGVNIKVTYPPVTVDLTSVAASTNGAIVLPTVVIISPDYSARVYWAELVVPVGAGGQTVNLSGTLASASTATSAIDLVLTSTTADLASAPLSVATSVVAPSIILGSLTVDLSAGPLSVATSVVDPDVTIFQGGTTVNLEGQAVALATGVVAPSVVQTGLTLDLATGPASLGTAVVDPDVTEGSALPVDTYSTSFPLTENPISEAGVWTNGGTDGGQWHDFQTTPGHAYSTMTGAAGDEYRDGVAVLKGTFNANQRASATVYINSYPPGWDEVELLLRFAITSNNARGYECYFHIVPHGDSTGYCIITRWNGAVGNFTELIRVASGVGLADGDVIAAEVVGSTIKVYRNNVLITSTTDTTWTDGNPGIGHDIWNSGTTQDPSVFGFTQYAAASILPLADLSGSPASSGTAASSATARLATVSVTPSAVSLNAEAITGTVVLGSLTVQPSAVTSSSASVVPSVTLGTLAVDLSASSASAGATTAGPTANQASLTLQASAVISQAATAAPGWVLGTVTVSPAARTLATSTNVPTVVLPSSLTVDLGGVVATTRGVVAEPTVEPPIVSVTAASVVANVALPIVLVTGGYTRVDLASGPVSASTATNAPTVGATQVTEVDVSGVPASSASAIVAPSVVCASLTVVLVVGASAGAASAGGEVILGAITLAVAQPAGSTLAVNVPIVRTGVLDRELVDLTGAAASVLTLVIAPSVYAGIALRIVIIRASARSRTLGARGRERTIVFSRRSVP